MLQKIKAIPSQYFQLALLNIGLIIALSKGLPLLNIITSLIFVGLFVAPIAISLGIISPPPHQILHEQISRKMRSWCNGLSNFFQNWKKLEQQRKFMTLIPLLFSLYVSLNFLCPCVQSYLIINFLFVYLFMHQEFELIQGYFCGICEGKCPLA